MIKAIVFDCFGVLTVDLWKEFVGRLPEEKKQPARDINHAYDAGLISNGEFLEHVRQLTGKTPGEVERLRNSDGKKNGQLLEYIAQLKRTYKVGMLSNIATNWVREAFLNEKEQALFDQMIFSYEVGITKPDARIFQIACERLGAQPQETVIVDDIPVYCEAAREFGMHAIQYKNFVQTKDELEQLLKR